MTSSDCWRGLKPEQIVQILSDAFTGFAGTMIVNINTTTISQLVGNQTHALTGLGCSGFTKDQFAVMTADAFSGFSDSCTEGTTAEAWGGITANALTGLSLDGIDALSAKQVAQIPADSVKGFTLEQMDNMLDGCGGFSSEQFFALKPEVFGKFSMFCTRKIPETAWAGLTAASGSFLTTESIRSIGADSFRNINPIGLSEWTVRQVAAIQGLSTISSCAVISASQLAAIPATSFAGIADTCIAYMDNAAFDKVNASQVSNISVDSIKRFTAYQMVHIPYNAVKGFTAAHLANFNTGPKSPCLAIDDKFIVNMSPMSFAGLTSIFCVDNIPNSAWGALSAKQLSYIPVDTFSWFPIKKLALFPPAAAAGYTGVQFAGMRADVCNVLTKYDTPYLSYEALSNMTAACFAYFDEDMFTAMTNQQFMSIRPKAFKSITKAQIASLDAKAQDRLTVAQLSGMDKIAFGDDGFSAGAYRRLLLKYGSQLINALSTSQLDSPSTTIAGRVTDYFNDKEIPLQDKDLPTDNNISTLHWLQVASLRAPTTFTSTMLDSLRLSATVGLRRNVVSTFSEAVIKRWPSGEFTTPQSVGIMTVNQFAALRKSTYMFFRASTWVGLNPITIPSLTEDHMMTIPRAAYLFFSCAQLGKFTAQQQQWIPSYNLNTFDSSMNSCGLSPAGSSGPFTPPFSYTPDGSSGPSTTTIVLAIGGVVIGVAIISGLAFWIIRSRRARNAELGYTLLASNVGPYGQQ
jgi:hypothetical protein